MSEKINNEFKKPIELDIDLENNQRALIRDIGKPEDGYYINKNQKDKVNDKKNVIDKKEDGFDYEKKYVKGEKNDLNDTMEESEICSNNPANDQNTRGTKLNPRLEQITEPDPDDKKKANYLSSINKRNRNQPL